MEKDCVKHQDDPREILVSFIGDPYQPEEMRLELTRESIKLLIRYNLTFTILTKGGTRGRRDFDLLEGYGKSRFGTTLILPQKEFNGLELTIEENLRRNFLLSRSDTA